jgi:hypothetical protein
MARGGHSSAAMESHHALNIGSMQTGLARYCSAGYGRTDQLTYRVKVQGLGRR